MQENKWFFVIFTLPSSTIWIPGLCNQAIESMLDPQRQASHPNIASGKVFPLQQSPPARLFLSLLVPPREADSQKSTCLSRQRLSTGCQLFLPNLNGKKAKESATCTWWMLREYRLMSSADFFSQISGPFASVMVEALMDEWNRDKMLEPPPVYNLMIFPGRRNTANQENKETQTLSLAQGWNVLFIVRSKSLFFAFFVPSEKTVVRSVNVKK